MAQYGAGRVFHPTYKDRHGEMKTVQKFYIEYYDHDGKQRRESTDAKSEKEAQKILNTRLHEASQGTLEAANTNKLTYGDIRAAILQDYAARKMKSLETLSNGEKTIKGMTKLDEFFGFSADSKGIKIRDITNQRWMKFIEDRRAEGISDATIRNSGVLLRQMFSVASSPEYKLLNPAQVPQLTMPKPPKPKKDFATREEFDRLLAAMPQRFHPYATWLFFQATRRREAFSITWSQVNLGEAVYYPNADNNKTGDDTPRPLSDEVVKALRSLPQGGPDAQLFSLHSEKAFTKIFRKACYRAELGKDAWKCGQCSAVVDGEKPEAGEPALVCEVCKKRSKGVLLVPMQWMYTGLTVHGLRRSTVVYFRDAGFADSEIMAVTGHRSPKTFLGYSSTRIEQMRKRLSSAAAERTRRLKQQKQLAG